MADLARYIGVPFREHGREIDGADCWGLILILYRDLFGIALRPFDTGYASTGRLGGPDIAALVADYRREWLEIADGQERYGDVVVMKFWQHPMHVGFVIERGRMLHALDGIDSCIACYNDPQWRRPNKVAGFFRHRDMVGRCST